MKKKFNINSKSLIKDVFTVSSGTIIAQIISVLMTPLITRLYGPTAYGVLGVFMSSVSMIGGISALTYPQAIVLPKKNDDAKSIVKISLIVSIILAIVLFIVIIFFNDSIVNLFTLHSIRKYLYLLPLVVVFTGMYQSFQQLNLRYKRFKVIAFATIIYTLTKNTLKVIFGLISPTATVLIVISTLSILIQTVLLIYKGRFVEDLIELIKNKLNNRDLSIASEYKDFPLYRAPQTLFNSTAQNLPVILFSVFFGPTISGYYTLSKTILTIPINLITKSVGDALYPRLSVNYNNNISIKRTLIKSTLILAIIGIIPFGFIMIFGPFLFELVFGSDWRMAGIIARWMSILLFFMFINRPVVTAIPIIKVQKEYLFYEVISTIVKLLGLFLGLYFYNDPIMTVIYYSVFGSISYLVLIIGIIIKVK